MDSVDLSQKEILKTPPTLKPIRIPKDELAKILSPFMMKRKPLPAPNIDKNMESFQLEPASDCKSNFKKQRKGTQTIHYEIA